ncbi:PIN domain-containing protein [Candidatus Woesearchaeota archaeon]|nr:PIN domain-containing protein [Candidatus Woesearchaeota archaeon]
MAKPELSENVNVYSFQSMATFKGFIKNGLDSSTMINLIICYDSKFDEFKERGFSSPPNLFFFHEISRAEIIGVLINKNKLTKNEAVDSFTKLVKEFNLMKIARGESAEEYEKIVEEANKKVVEKENNQSLKIGEADIIIIGGFLKEKINLVHTGDKGFEKTCTELGMTVMPLPKRDFEKEKEFKKIMKHRDKC